MKILPIILSAVVLTGCSVTKYGSFFNASLGNNRSVEGASFVVDTNGVKHFNIQGYKSDQAQAAGAMAEGLSRGFASYLTGGAATVVGNPATPVVAKNATPQIPGKESLKIGDVIYTLVQEPNAAGEGLYIYTDPSGKFVTPKDGKMIPLP